MKKIIIALFAVIMLASCGVGSYHVSSGRPDDAYISFTAFRKTPISVTVDGKGYILEAAKQKGYRTDRAIKQTSKNTIALTPGQHEVKVQDETGKQVYEHKIVLGAQEHRIVDLPL